MVLINLFVIVLQNALLDARPEPIPVLVSIAPQREIVERIGGEHVSVSVLIPANVDPHHHDLRPSELKSVEKARLFVKLGTGIEIERTKFDTIRELNPTMKVIDSSKSIQDQLLGGGHSHHGHGHTDPHIWHSLVMMRPQIEEVAAALTELRPDARAQFESNRMALLTEFDSTHRKIQDRLASFRGRKFLVIHPFLAYFARDYGLTQLSLSKDHHNFSPALLKETRKKYGSSLPLMLLEQESARQGRDVAAMMGGSPMVPLPTFPAPIARGILDVATALEKAFRSESQ